MPNPKPQTVPSYLRKGIFGIRNLTLNEVNTALLNISLRLNQLDAIGQNPDVKGRTIKNLGAGVENPDAVRLDQVLLANDFNRVIETFTQTDLVAGVYTFNHGLGRKEILIQVLNENEDEISTDSIKRTDIDNAHIDVSSWGDITGKTFTVIGIG